MKFRRVFFRLESHRQQSATRPRCSAADCAGLGTLARITVDAKTNLASSAKRLAYACAVVWHEDVPLVVTL